MKNLFLLIGLQFLFQYSICQIPFAPLGAKWYYINEDCDPNSSSAFYTSKEVVKDSVINGRYCTLVRSSYCPFIPSCEQDNYVSQDGSKVYVYDSMLDDFQILFDFSLEAGDTYQMRICEFYWDTDSVTVRIDYADADVNGYQSITLLFNENGNWDSISPIYIKKGIGWVGDNPLFPPYCGVTTDPCYVTSLACYETPTTGVISINGPCTDAVSEPTSTFSSFLYPNPASKTCTLRISSLPTDSKWELINQLGQTVKREMLPPGKQEQLMPLGGIAPGIYFWALTSVEKQIATGKLVVVK